ncbi:LysR family transcriptional regulator [Cupriavidus plantarum]|uniref:LysR family transcriptional regulator n=2 Tax=Cupriavidus plantarum TaxID=942865 RepID=UPI00339D9D26
MDYNDLAAFVAVVKAGGFRDAARARGVSASSLSIAIRRLEARLDLRLLNRTTRSVAATEAGQRLLERLTPLFGEMEAALDVLNRYRDSPSGTLRLNVPASAARTLLPQLLPEFLRAYRDIRVEVVVEDGFVDLLSIGCDAGIRYDEALEQDMIALPIGPRFQQFTTAASPAYLAEYGTPAHPRELLSHMALRGQFSGGAKPAWQFERDGEVVRIDAPSRLLVRPGAALGLIIESAVAGLGIVHLFEEMLQPAVESGALVPILTDWKQRFPGPFLYYAGRRHIPAPLAAFIDWIRARNPGSPDLSPLRD